MSSKKDMRRPDLVVPYVEPPQEEQSTDMTTTMSTTLPMVAMFTRNRMIGWAAVMVAVQGWLAETPEQRKKASTPSWMSVIMSMSSAAVTYMPLFLPPQAPKVAPSGSGAAAPVPAP